MNILPVFFGSLLLVLGFLFSGCTGTGGSGDEKVESNCGPVVQNINVPCDQVENTEAATEDNGGAIEEKGVCIDGNITLIGCNIVPTGDTSTDTNTFEDNDQDNDSDVGGNA